LGEPFWRSLIWCCARAKASVLAKKVHLPATVKGALPAGTHRWTVADCRSILPTGVIPCGQNEGRIITVHSF
jgi:hypothetical protein